jgi:hypothetical protein
MDCFSFFAPFSLCSAPLICGKGRYCLVASLGKKNGLGYAVPALALGDVRRKGKPRARFARRANFFESDHGGRKFFGS